MKGISVGNACTDWYDDCDYEKSCSRIDYIWWRGIYGPKERKHIEDYCFVQDDKQKCADAINYTLKDLMKGINIYNLNLDCWTDNSSFNYAKYLEIRF